MSRSPLPWDDFANDLGFRDEEEMLYCFFVLDCQPPSCIADLIGVEKSTIHFRMRRAGFKMKSRGGPNARPAAKTRWHLHARKLGFETEIDMLREYRWHYEDLAEKLDICHTAIRNRLRKYGLTPATKRIGSPKFKKLWAAEKRKEVI